MPRATRVKKEKCEVDSEICSGEGVRKWTGTKKGDPVFNCCMACVAKLRMAGVRMKEI